MHLVAIWIAIRRSASSGVRLCVCNQWTYVGNCADAVDRLLIRNQNNGILV